jgi:hypothetical protein
MNEFQNTFSESNIVRELCKARIKLAKKRHDRAFLHNIRKDHPATHDLVPKNWRAISLKIFPPRRQWHRFRPYMSRRGSRPPLDINVETLFRATIKLKKLSPGAPWAKKLDKTVARIRKRALSKGKFKFSPPSISPIEKNPATHEYRPLVLFCLEDKIIDCLAARYLRESLDDSLSESCLAFRCRRPKKAPPTIHGALEKIVNKRKNTRRADLFVAECDIKGFFDCVSHKFVLKAFDEMIAAARGADSSFDIDRRALAILKAYLRTYSYSRDIHNSKEASKLLKEHDPVGWYKWPREDLRLLYGKEKLSDIGIPQGGALSCLIANVVLHSADEAINARRVKGPRVLYLRYCDDMILIASKQRDCKQAFKRYRSALERLRLPIHPPKTVKSYLTRKSKLSFWNGKSNHPYRWGSASNGGIPWIQFVGYQVRYDGMVRIRPKSLKKQFRKVSKASAELLHAIRSASLSSIRKSRQQIRHRLRTRLISIAVGRRTLGPLVEGPLPMCWANGFRGLVSHNFVVHPLKALDRHREQQIRVIDRALVPLKLPKVADHRSKAYRYYGRPFSYLGQFPSAQ